jgi:hypothetical protein
MSETSLAASFRFQFARWAPEQGPEGAGFEAATDDSPWQTNQRALPRVRPRRSTGSSRWLPNTEPT